ncbi:MAG TPA: hypothetical protein VJB12_01830 [Candidatus Nanoarchaeia archaeon]|nr:hypothetical protein [Candidatus Nanoarchaeia archaeon]
MNEALENTIEELKRVDHLFYVSLKYTRTVDMIKHVLERIISTHECAIETMLKYAKEKNLIDSIPPSPAMRTEVLKKTYPNDALMQDAVQRLNLLLKLRRARYTSREEFRRHVTMIATLDNSEVLEVSIDTVGEYYQKTREFVDFVFHTVRGKE